MKETNLIHSDNKGGYLVVTIENDEKQKSLRLHKRYYLGAEVEVNLSFDEIEALVLNLKNKIDASKLARQLLGLGDNIDMFHRDNRGRIKTLIS